MTRAQDNIFIILLTVVVLVGCIGTPAETTVLRPTMNVIASATPQFTATLDPTEAYIYSFPNSLTPAPTMDTESLSRMIGLLQSDTCELPCYLGITPGQTTWDEAETILDNLEAFYSFNTDANGLLIHNIHLDIGSELAGVTSDLRTNNTGLSIGQSLQLLVKDGMVQKLWTTVSTGAPSASVPLFDDYWSRYSLEEVLHRLGVPNQIVMDPPFPGATGTGFILVYGQIGVIVQIGEEIRDNQICQGSEKSYAYLQLILTNISSGMDLYRPGGVAPTDSEVYKPIKDVLGIDEDEFYSALMSNPSKCFEIQNHTP
jgi:hypothetical protein